MGLWRSGQWREAPRPAPRSTFECRARRGRERPGKRGADPRAGSGATLVRRAGGTRPRAPGRERSAAERSALSRRGGFARPSSPPRGPRPPRAAGGAPAVPAPALGPDAAARSPRLFEWGGARAGSRSAAATPPAELPERADGFSIRQPGRVPSAGVTSRNGRTPVITTINNRKYPNIAAGWVSAWKAVIEAVRRISPKGGGRKGLINQTYLEGCKH